ncbi:MAG: hypothetical protein Alpg2KO_24170 [Alphaproteobacteria bacterium]
MEYADLAVFARSWGAVFLLILFLSAVAFAVWPGNRDKFEHAANMPLDEED